MEYDGWAERYDDDTQRFGWCAPEVVLEAVAAVGASTGDVLDLGVGTGRCSVPLAHKGARIVGVDNSEAMLQQASKAGTFAALHCLELGATPLCPPLTRGSFDLVVSCGVLHFVGPLAELFDEVASVLRSGGWFVFTSIPPQTRSFSDATHVRGSADVQAMLARAGFSAGEPNRFTAYYAQGDRNEPVLYEQWQAQRPR